MNSYQFPHDQQLTAFDQLSADQQLALFSAAARAALERWTPASHAEISLITLRSNAVFAVEFPASHESASFRMVLRVNWPGRRSLGDIEAELLWMDVLRRHQIAVPAIVYKAEAVIPDGSPTPLICTLFSYLDGESVAPQDYTSHHAEAVGRGAAQIHNIAPDFGAGERRPRLDFHGLFGPKSIYNVGAAGEALLAPHRPVLDAVTARVSDVFSWLDAERGAFGMIHGDLKPDNMLFAAPDQPCLLDFDDCGWGYFLYEFAPLLLFLRGETPAQYDPRYQALKAAAWKGYTAVRPLPGWQYDALETLVAGRFVASCLWVAAHRNHPAYRGRAEAILAQRAARLAGFLESDSL